MKLLSMVGLPNVLNIFLFLIRNLNDISLMNHNQYQDCSHWLNASQSGQFILFPALPSSHIWVRCIQFQLRQDNNNSNFRLRLKVKILFQSRVRRNIFYIYSRFRYFRRTFLDIGYYENHNTKLSTHNVPEIVV